MASPLAHAQQAVEPNLADNPEQSSKLPEITVRATALDNYAAPVASTGTKTDVPLQDTPVNVQVVTQQLLIDQSALTLDQALTNISGVTSAFQSGSVQDLIVRGFDTNQVLFLDGVRIYDHYGNGIQNLADLDRIEVMKGPAAVLYGEAEPGGIVNLVSKVPDASGYSSVEQRVGSWSQAIFRFDTTGPIDAQRDILYRIDGSWENSESWRDGVWARTVFVAPAVTWNLTPSTQVSLKYVYDRSPGAIDNNQVVPIADGRLVEIPRHVNFSDPEFTYQKNIMSRAVLSLVQRFGNDWSLKLQATDYSARSEGLVVNSAPFIEPGTPGNVGNGYNILLADGSYSVSNEKTKAVSADLIGHFGVGQIENTLLVGADFSKYTEPLYSIFNAPDFVGVNLPVDMTVNVPIPLDPDPADALTANQLILDKGVYVQDQVKLPGGIDLLAGLRYQDWHNDASAYFMGGQLIYGGSTYDSSAVTPRIGAVYELTRSFSIYALYSDGFYPNQGFDYRAQPLKATGADDREIGVKYLSDGGRLQAVVSAYYLTKTNVPAPDVNHPVDGTYPFDTTIGAERSKGLEFDLRGEILPGWKLIATYAYTDARVTKDTNSITTTGIPSTVGDRLANVPWNMASVWSTYDFHCGRDAAWTVGAGIVARGDSLDVTNQLSVPGYATVNAMIRYADMWGSRRVSVQFNVDNVLDRHTLLFGYPYQQFYPNTAGVVYGNPRSFTLNGKLEF